MKYTFSLVLLLLMQFCLHGHGATQMHDKSSNNNSSAAPSTDPVIITFENSSNHLEGEHIDKLLIVVYRTLRSENQVVELSVANHCSSFHKLQEILKTLQYNGVSTDHILIKTINPTECNADHVSLRTIAQPNSYANKHDLHTADFYTSH